MLKILKRSFWFKVAGAVAVAAVDAEDVAAAVAAVEDVAAAVVLDVFAVRVVSVALDVFAAQDVSDVQAASADRLTEVREMRP